jgi:Flp pilus assembly pilin Flp
MKFPKFQFWHPLCLLTLKGKEERDMNKFRKNESGQGMTEYVIIVALIAVAAIAVVGFFGDVVRNQFYNMTAALAGSSSHSDTGKFVKKAEQEKNQRGMDDFSSSAR